MSINLTSLALATRRTVGSRRFWYFVLGLFLLETLWFVFSAQYPMAFDENYHFGLVQLHAKQWLPYFTSQPHGAAAYGAVWRDPSYLYHWLMSFPYRFITLFTLNQTTQVIFLRLINLGMFTYGLTLYRKVMKRCGVSDAFIHAALLLFILIPVVPFLAAQINYDNLLFVAVSLAALLSFRLLDGFKRKYVRADTTIQLIIVLLLGSLIKYPFLPILLIIALFMIWRLRRERLSGRNLWGSFASSFTSLSRLSRIFLVVGVILAAGLFAERYGVNILRYHTPIPDCQAVISRQECLQYSPWGRDFYLAQNKPAGFHPNILVYTADWFWGMWYRLFFAINQSYVTRPPLAVISVTAIIVAGLLGIGTVLRLRQLLRNSPERMLLLVLVLGYSLVLFADEFKSYLHTGQPVAINGRYLLPFIPLLFILAGQAWSQLLRGKTVLKTGVAGLLVVVFMLQGGGTMTYIVRSDDNWFWNNSLVRTVNRDVKHAISPLIIDV